MGADVILKNTALIAAIVAALGWVLNKGFEACAKWIGDRRTRQAAIIRFYVDIGLRVEFLVQLNQPAKVANLKIQYENTIADYDARGLKFRAYGVQVSDRRSHEDIDKYLATVSLENAYLVKRVVLLDQQMTAEYEKSQSDAFASLTSTQQLDILMQWINSAQILCQSIVELRKVMGAWPELQNTNTISPFYNLRRMMIGPTAQPPRSNPDTDQHKAGEV